MAKAIGAVLREARERAGISQSGLGQLIGMAPNMISRIEAGVRETPSFATIARIAGALGISLDQVAGECGLIPKGDRSSTRSANAVAAMAEIQSVKRALERVQGQLDRAAARLAGKARKP